MSTIRKLAGLMLVVSVSGCCFGGKSPEKTAKVKAAETAKIRKADPQAFKSVQKVAIVSITAECDVVNKTGKGGLGALKKQDDYRTPRMLDLSAPAFAKVVAESSGWSVMPFEEMIANPAYLEQTFSADLREQVKQTRKLLGCAGGGYRVLSPKYSDRAGALAKALGVDAVIVGHFEASLEFTKASVNPDYGIVASGGVNVFGPTGELLYRTAVRGLSDKMPTADWSKVPALGVSAFEAAARDFCNTLRKAGGGQVAASPEPEEGAPAPTGEDAAAKAPTSVGPPESFKPSDKIKWSMVKLPDGMTFEDSFRVLVAVIQGQDTYKVKAEAADKGQITSTWTKDAARGYSVRLVLRYTKNRKKVGVAAQARFKAGDQVQKGMDTLAQEALKADVVEALKL